MVTKPVQLNMSKGIPANLNEQDFLNFLLRIRKFDYYAQEYLKIRNKAGESISFKMNTEQVKVYKIIQKLKQQNKPVRLIILKSRQEGISTLIEGFVFHDSVINPLRNSLIISHDPDGSNNLFKMCKFFYENVPEDMRPMKRYSNKKELVFDNPKDEERLAGIKGLESSITVSTASKTEVRGSTIQNLHGSEVAFWPNATELMLAASQMVPDLPNTMIALESTGNGIGGYFYDTWVKAITGKNSYIPIFLPWWDFKEYEREWEVGMTLIEDEIEIKNLYNLSNEKIAWRRWAIANKCNGDILKFNQEYPACWEEAFVASGSPKFNMPNLRMMYAYRKDPIFIGEIDGEFTHDGLLQSGPILTPSQSGRLKIYQKPKQGHYYTIGGDVAKGTPTSDNSCLQVYDVKFGDCVATWYGKIDPTEFAKVSALLGMHYAGAFKEHGALLAVEVNRDGITTNRELYYNLRYKNLYFRRNLMNKGDDKGESLGFLTSGTTRPIIINALADFITNAEGELNDEQSLLECQTFVINKSGFPEAQEGSHDDAVMALSIAIHVANYVKIPDSKESREIIRARTRVRRGTEEEKAFRRDDKTTHDNW